MKERICAFANYYFNIFRDPKSTNNQVEEGFAEKCFALGFEMDCGNSFSEKYPKAFNDYSELDKIIGEIDDPQFLGTAIFSQWRYITHWSYCSHPLDEQYRPWFISAFARLVAITSENNAPPYVFYGNAKKIKINSNCMAYGPCPDKDDEIEQHLTITDEGRVWLTRYAFGAGLNRYKKIEQKQFRIDPQKAKFLLDEYTKYFRDEYEIPFATDSGSFEMLLTDDEGKTAVFMGPLVCDFEVDGYNLSQLTRDMVEDQSLFVFDGNAYECIKRITIDHWFTKVIVPQEGFKKAYWNYSDHLVIDWETETIEDILKIAEQCDVTRKYHVAEGVRSFLDSLDKNTLFTEFYEQEEDDGDPIEGAAEYKVTVEFRCREPRIISGRYDKQGLPKDWPEFIEDLKEFISFYGFGEMFFQDQYGKTYRKRSDYIFLSVRFGDYGKTYYYLTDDDSIDVGDQVVVPVGYNGTERIVEVVKKEYFAPDNVPMSIDTVKSIVGKFIRPQENEDGKMMIFCPMCECEISADTCYDILYDPLTRDVPGVITEDEIKAKEDICKKCMYHDE